MRKFQKDRRLKEFLRTPRGIFIGLWFSYFVYWGAMASLHGYLNLYFQSIGLSGIQIGRLSSLRMIVSFIGAIILAFLTDIMRKTKMMLIICMAGMSATLIFYPQMSTFALLIPVVLLHSIFQSPVMSILDQNTLSSLENPRDYSRVRVGGSIGWGLSVLGIGFLLDQPGIPMQIIFLLSFILLLVMMLLVILLPANPDEERQKAQKASLADIKNLFLIPGFALWMAILFARGFTESSVMNFYFIYLRDIGVSASFIGTLVIIGIAGETVGFSLARRIQSRRGARSMMLLSMVMRILWFGLVIMINQPSLLLLVQLLDGVSIAMIFSSSVAYVNERVPGHIGTTAQAIRAMVFSSLSGAVGSLFSGSLYDNYGGKTMFAVMAVILMITLVFGYLLRKVESKRKSGYALNQVED